MDRARNELLNVQAKGYFIHGFQSAGEAALIAQGSP